MNKELPEGWVNVVLQDLFSHVTGGDWGLDPETIGAEGFSKAVCIRGGELRNWRIDKGKTASIRLVKDTSINTRSLKIGDILLEISGGGPDQPVGRTVIIDEDVFKNHPELPKVCTNFLRLIRLVDIVNKQYITQYLQYFYSSGEVVKYQGGSNNLRNLKFGDYSSIKIPLPPIPEQQRIVAKLDVLFGQLDKIKTHLERIPQLLKDFRQKVLTQAVTGKFDEYIELGDYDINIQTGPFGSALHKEDYVENGIPVINPSHIFEGEIIPNQEVTITEDKLNELSRWILEDGDVILGRRGEMGRAAAYFEPNQKMICGTGSVVLKKSSKVDSLFLMYYLRSAFAISFLETNSIGSTMVNLNQKIIKSIPFPNIDIKEQRRRIGKIESLFAKADKIEASYQKLKEKIEQLPQAILAKAFRGELVEQLPTDGDARELLEEIKKLKGEGTGAGKGKKLKPEEEMRMVAEAGVKYGKK